jgi:hypothetical protein
MIELEVKKYRGIGTTIYALMRTGSLIMGTFSKFYLFNQHFCATFKDFSFIWWRLVFIGASENTCTLYVQYIWGETNDLPQIN